MRFHAIEPRLPVRDFRTSLDFYVDVLGFEQQGGEEPDFALLRKDRIGLQIVRAGKHHPFGAMTVWIDCDSVLGIHEALRSRCVVEWGPEVYWYGRREFAVLDPDGHRIIFSETTDDAPTCRD